MDIRTISIEEIKSDFGNMNMRLIGFFGKQEFENVRLYDYDSNVVEVQV